MSRLPQARGLARWQARWRAWAGRLLMRACARLLAGPQAGWAGAMQAEVEAIRAIEAVSGQGDGREALAFAWGCFCAALGHALAHVLVNALVKVEARSVSPAAAGVLACTAAVLLGCLFMHLAGAPGHYVGMNLGSLAIAVLTFALLPRPRLQQEALLRGRLAAALGACLLAAGLGGAGAGASPWLQLGPVTVHLVWLLLPALLMASDVGPQAVAQRWAWGGLLMTLGALVLQADAPLAGLVAAFLALRAWRQRSGALAGLAGLAAAVALHAVSRWSAADAVPFVDRVLQQGFDQHPAAGLVLALALLLPLAAAWRQRQAREFGGFWGLWVAMSLPGWLPSPLVGFGGSFIVGHLLSLALLPGQSGGRGGAGGPPGTGAAPQTAFRPRSGLG